MKKIYYKVVTIENGLRVSAWAVGKARLEYPPKAIVKADPMTAGIFVFTNEEDAEVFRGKGPMKDNRTKIIPCHGIGPARCFKKIVMSERRNIILYLYTKSWGKNVKMADAPNGTVCFNAVQLLE